MTKIGVSCPDCGAVRDVDDRLGGGTVTCAACGTPIRIPMPGLAEGTHLGNFILLRRLGAGAMGEVWLARQKSMDRLVALKVLARDLTYHPDFVTRFRKEVKISAQLEHPNIVTAFDAGCEDDTHFLAISYVDGETLSDRLAHLGALPEQEALRMARDIARALRYAWTQFRLLHRDIKPSNIMIDREGTVKLMDMGISKCAAENVQLTMTGAIVGTPHYMSPEQAVGEKDLDCRSDIYSLGATLYHLVTGTVPFDSTTTMGIVSKHLTEPFPPPQERNPAVSDPCAVLLETMMARQRDQRPAGWDEVVRDIDLVLAERFPVTPRPFVGASLVTRPLPGNAPPTVTLPEEEEETPAVASPSAPKAIQEMAMPRRPWRWTARHSLVVVLSLLILGLTLWLIRLASVSRPSSPLPIPEDRPAEMTETMPFQALPEAGSDRHDPAPDHVDAAAPPPHDDPDAAVWQAAVAFAQAHPNDHDAILRTFTEVARNLPGTRYQLLADIEIRRLEAARKQAAEEVTAGLAREAENLAAEGQYIPAAELLESYHGHLREETAPARHGLAVRWRQQAEAAARAADDEAAKNERLHHERRQRLAEAILAGRLRQIRAEGTEPDPAATPPDLAPILDALAKAPEALVASLQADVGKTIVLTTPKGRTEVRLVGVADTALQIEQRIGKATMRRRVPFLALGQDEILRRSGLEGDAATVFLAIQAVKEKRFAEARKLIHRCRTEVSEPMLAALAALSGETEDLPAPPAATAPPPPPDDRQQTPSPGRAEIPTPATVQEALRRANPGYDGRGQIVADPDGTIAEVLLGGCPEIEDLAPLAGLPLRFVDLSDTGVTDLSPLSSAPLHGLNLDRCRQLTNLAPLATIRSLRFLNAHATGVVDLTPLQGMALNSLNLDGTGVRDLSPLKGMPLRELRLEACPIDDYAMLAEMDTLERLMPPDLWRHVPGGPPEQDDQFPPRPRRLERRRLIP